MPSKSAAQVRQQIEFSLPSRMGLALSPRGRATPERVACGVQAFDDLLLGGLPVGAVSEFVGPECSGRTTMAISYVSRMTRSGKVAAWIDTADALDPETAAANGVDLQRLLWVRCGWQEGRAVEYGRTDAAGILPVASSGAAAPSRGGGGSPHPRTERKDMPEAISAMLKAHGGLYDKHVSRNRITAGTPSAPNRPLLFRSQDREEQVASDRVPGRRGMAAVGFSASAARAAEGSSREGLMEWKAADQAAPTAGRGRKMSCWRALDHALKSTDLLLQAGGFSVIVLDLASMPAEMAWRIPLATWFRFRAACERSRASLLLLTQHSCARSSAELVLCMAAGEMAGENKVMTGVAYCANKERQRFQGSENVVSIRKQPQPERGDGTYWTGRAAWATAP